MTPTNLAQHVAFIETTHGMDLLADYVAWIESDGITVVATKCGRRKSVVKKYHRVYTVLSAATVQAAIREAGLSFNVILELGSAVYPLRKRKDRTRLLISLCEALAGLDADQALSVIRELIASWIGDTTRRPDVACMHTMVGKDGKRRLIAAFNTPVAARIDTILHRLAERLKRNNPTLQYDQAYAQALIHKLTGSDSDAGNADSEGLFGPMFMIPTTCHFHNDGTITTTDGAHVNICDVVDEKIADTGWAAVTGTTNDSPTIPLVTGLVQVHRRFATEPQRLAAILEHLVCTWPGCDVPAAKCHIHHITAYHHGGLTTGTNLAPLCKHHNGKNDDNPGKHCNGHIERDPHTGRPGLRRHPNTPLEFNTHPLTHKTL